MQKYTDLYCICIYIYIDCFQDIPKEKGDTAATTCDPLQTTIQPAQPVCTATDSDIVISTTTVTENLFSAMIVESVLTERHYVTVTATYTIDIPQVSSLPCTQLPQVNSSSVQDVTQASNFSPGAIAAIILAVVLVILIIACTVAWVVCLKRKKDKLERQGSGRLYKNVFVHAVSYRKCLACMYQL